ncbi:MAG: nucleotidyltransferase substrate binding protein [Candidatus Cloacimonadota bacterium]|nr:nucleotidyltransferase substrate binding protein [Candidatus Cloacimonadota bacterium]
MHLQDIRWKQRFSNYKKALFQLKKFIDKNELSNLEKQGLIKSFEYTYELAWNTMKDFLEYQGTQDIIGSRDTLRIAFKTGIIADAETWMDMLKSRNRTSHTYNEEIADEICNSIVDKYFSLFVILKNKMGKVQKKSELTIFDKV